MHIVQSLIEQYIPTVDYVPPEIRTRAKARSIRDIASHILMNFQNDNPATVANRPITRDEAAPLITQMLKSEVFSPIMGAKSECWSAEPNQPANRFQSLRKIAKKISITGEPDPVITLGQLMVLANTHPHLGIYSHELGIGRRDAGNRMTSAFSTPMEFMPHYANAYGQIATEAITKLIESANITEKNQLQIIIVGDGEGRVTSNIIQKILKQGINPRLLRIQVMDLGIGQLRIQEERLADSRIPIEFQRYDASNIASYLHDIKASQTGLIILGEEVLDDFPVFAVKRDHVTGLLNEQTFTLHESETFSFGEYQYPPIFQALFTEWFKLFPHYEELLKRNPHTFIPVDFDLLRFLSYIGLQAYQGKFNGYMIGGDYSGIFNMSSRNHPLPIRGYSRGSNIVSPEEALRRTMNITHDVDHHMFAILKIFGVDVSLMRMAHFISLSESRQLFSPKEIYDLIYGLKQKYHTKSLPDAPTMNHDHEMLLVLETMFCERFNWIVKLGSAPALFPDIDKHNIW